MAFPDNCTPRLISVDDSCGCTLTRANISAMTPQMFEDQAMKEVGMDRIIAQTKEARMTGVKESALTDLFMSRMAPVKTINLTPGGTRSVIAPYLLVPQRHNVNANYFEIVTGAATPGAGTGDIPASAWDITVRNHQGSFSTPLTSLEKYFLPGRMVTVLYKDLGTGAGRTAQLKILSVVNADSGIPRAKLTCEPNYTASGWSGLSAGAKAVYQATHGVLIPLANSVSDYESWCYNDPSEINNKLLTFWLQTIRETHCYNDEYLKALQAPLTSDYFKKFRTLPLAEQRKRQSYLAERAFKNTLFFGQRISELQTVETYAQLPAVKDPNNTSCTLEYKANTLGFRQQLADCGRVTDFNGAQLDFDTVSAALYNLKRYREVDSGTIDRIDCFTDRFTANNILTLMTDYYTRKYGVNTTRFYKPGESLKYNGNVLWNYNVYEFPEQSVELAVITDPFFDDYLSAFPTADKSKGRFLMMLDWSDVKVGLAGTNSATRQTNVADSLYKCVITPNVSHYQLTSKTIAAMIESPNRHMIYENFSEACPKLTGAVGCHSS